MRKPVPVLAGVVAILVIFALLAYGWYEWYGPGRGKRNDRAITTAASSEKTTARAAAAIAKASRLPAKWQGLAFNEVSETDVIKNDLAAQRGYTVDKRRDPAAIAVAKDLSETIALLNKVTKDLKESSADLKAVTGGALSDVVRARVDRAIAANRTVTRRVVVTQEGLTELQHDNDVWGFFALCLQTNAQLIAQLDTARATLKNGDFATARTQALAAKELVNVSSTWLTLANQELTNIGVYSQDADRLLDFSSRAKDVAEMLDQASSAGLRQEANSLAALARNADDQLDGLHQLAADRAIGKDYAYWYNAQARRWLGS